MQRSETRILTTHAGSLPRPPALTEAFTAMMAAEDSTAAMPDDFDDLVRQGTEDVVRRQLAAGIDIGSNGEQPREGFFAYVKRRFSGFGGRHTRASPRDIERYPGFRAQREAMMAGRTAVSNFALPTATGPIRYRDPSAVETECRDFRAALEAADGEFIEAFLTAPSPGIIAAAMRDDHYGDRAAYVADLAAALRIEYRAIVAHGFLLQLDCPDLALERHISFADASLADFHAFIDLIVDAINSALDGIPREAVRMHVCWGNYEGPHDCDVPLPDILANLLRARVGGFMLPMANPRHAHEHACLGPDTLAPDQVFQVGVIDTTTNYIEHPEVVAERIERLARAIGDPRRIIASTDCGFDTSAGMGRVAPDVVWAKLESLTEGAARASQRLF